MTARFQIVGARANGSRLVPNQWLAGRSRTAAWPDLVAPVGWRLVAANNRELGRSAELFDDERRAAQAALEVTGLLAASTAAVTFDPVFRLWTWWLSVDSRSYATSVRGHERERDCVANLHQFCANAPAATLQPSPLAPRRPGYAARPANDVRVRRPTSVVPLARTSPELPPRRARPAVLRGPCP